MVREHRRDAGCSVQYQVRAGDPPPLQRRKRPQRPQEMPGFLTLFCSHVFLNGGCRIMEGIPDVVWHLVQPNPF